MKKAYFLIVSLFICIGSLFAATVSEEEAAIVAKSIIGPSAEISVLTENYYLFAGEESGFAMVSRDNRLAPIIAFSASAPAGYNPAFKDWARSFQETAADRISRRREIHPLWASFREKDVYEVKTAAADSVPPLLSTAWNQTHPYNSRFPAVPGSWAPGSGSNGRVFVGCVAVVMGQIMNFYGHPEFPVGSYGYEEPAVGAQSVDYYPCFYDWDYISNNIFGMSAGDEINDAAGLLYHCAVSVGMQYSEDGSSSAVEDAVYALVSHFDYDRDFQLAYSADYDGGAWSALLKAELDAGRPIMYRGEGSGGHAFICDGYKVISEQSYFHFNWGWGGYYDGWFLINDLTPGDNDFTDNQAAVLGIHPSDSSDVTLAYQGFERIPYRGWILDSQAYYTENGAYDLVREKEYSVGFSNSGQRLVTPSIHVENDNQARVSFWAKTLNGKFCRVAVSTTDTEAASFTNELDVIQPTDGIWQYYEYSLRSYKEQDIHIALEYLSDTTFFFVDNFMVRGSRSVVAADELLPVTHDLIAAYPNPVNGEIHIGFDLETAGDVRVALYGLDGKKEMEFFRGYCEAGRYRLDNMPLELPSGMYILNLLSDGRSLGSRKITVLK